MIPSFVIYNCTNYYIGWHHITGYDEVSQTFRFSYAKEDGTDRILGMERFIEVFDKETQDVAQAH